jgi:hypothetical protein
MQYSTATYACEMRLGINSKRSKEVHDEIQERSSYI